MKIEVANLLKNHLESSEAYERPSGLPGPVKLRLRSRQVVWSVENSQ